MKRIVIFFITAITLIIFGGTSAISSDCRRGVLDKAYCDEDLDLVADLPMDESEWVNPSTIIFTYTPVEDPAVYANIWELYTTKSVGHKSFDFTSTLESL